MGREILIAPEGKYYTNGTTYGKEIYLAVDLDGSNYFLIDEEEVRAWEQAQEEDYLNSLAELGVE